MGHHTIYRRRLSVRSPRPPTEPVLLYQSPLASVSSVTIHGSREWNCTPVIAPQNATVTSVALRGYRVGNGEPLIRMELRAGGSTTPGAVLSASADRPGIEMTVADTWNLFSITPYDWVSGTPYWIGTWSNGGSGSHYQRHDYGPWTDALGRRIRFTTNLVTWYSDAVGRGMLVQAWGFPG